MVRTIEQWKDLLAGYSAKGAASLILADLIGYSSKNQWRREDCEQLANAMAGWASMWSMKP